MTDKPAQTEKPLAMYTRHSRKWLHNRYVYPVISRRSGGLSIGINLNPDKICNFGCVYCQVERSSDDQQPEPVDVAIVQAELRDLLQSVTDGTLWEDSFFDDVPKDKRVLRDIAFSGDAEPTSSPSFLAVVLAAAEMKRAFSLWDVKLVLITNATLLTRSSVAEALLVIKANNGEIWAKLDAGTPEYYKLVNQPVIPFARVLENILMAGRQQPIVIQTMVASISGKPFPVNEQEDYIHKLTELINLGCRITRIQLYTVARDPGESNLPENCDVKAVDVSYMSDFKSRINQHLNSVQVDTY
jgi:wyosine [tRNA(Phe)-imidazoG37] synthetase (radical SAM superfamily)